MVDVYLSLGSNLEREKHISACVKALRLSFGDVVLSRVYESEAVDFDGDNFYNLAVKIVTDKPLSELLVELRGIEARNGRVRNSHTSLNTSPDNSHSCFNARTADIDILTYGDLIGRVSGIQLPREDILTRAFVLRPLAEIAPDELHLLMQKTFSQLWQDFDVKYQKLWPVDFFPA